MQELIELYSDDDEDDDNDDDDEEKDRKAQPKDVIKITMEERLSNLGSKIGALHSKKKVSCFDTIRGIKEDAEDFETAAMQFTQMLRPICEQERCVSTN